ncbi:MAG TPA: membrane protein insertion efficiency factor YidD [Thermoanaerobaculia bacterium]|nr:membrane protein insertion efficiency factor YidD [Thermoanaerobaculia bacterium]
MIAHTRRHLAPGALAIAFLAGYQRWISPLLPAACRFTPTCSEYARLAFVRHGFWSATWLTVRRLSRCHPFHPGGVDLP